MNHQVQINLSEWEQTKDVSKEIIGLPKKYNVKMYNLEYKDKTKSYWSCTRVDISIDNALLLTFFRNYYRPPMIYAVQYGKGYLITSADYQCITIINLTDRNIESYTQEENFKFGCGFCPIDFYFEEDTNTLSVFGCIWGAPFETMEITNVDLANFDKTWNNKNNIRYIEEDIDETDE